MYGKAYSLKPFPILLEEAWKYSYIADKHTWHSYSGALADTAVIVSAVNELERQEQSVEVRICPLSPLEYRWSSSCVRDANMTAEFYNDYTEEQKKPFGDQLEFSVYTGPSYTLKTAWKLLGGGIYLFCWYSLSTN